MSPPKKKREAQVLSHSLPLPFTIVVIVLQAPLEPFRLGLAWGKAGSYHES